MATPNPNPTQPQQPPPMVFDDAPAQQQTTQQPPPMVFDDAPAQQQRPMVLDAPPAEPSILDRLKDKISGLSDAMEVNPAWAETIGAGKETANALAGILNIVNQHASGAIPTDARSHMANAAQWLKQQGEMRGWSEPGGMGEHMGAMGADYLGFEGLASLIGGAAGAAGTGAGAVGTALEGTEIAKTLKQVANLGDVLDKYPVLKQAAGIGLRTISEVMPGLKNVAAGVKTAAAGGAQSYIMSGGDAQQAKEAGLISGLIHFGSATSLAPLGDYLTRLAQEAGVLKEPLPPPLYQAQEPEPTAPAPDIPDRAPAAERFSSAEQEAAQAATRASLEDLNQFRQVDERGTPTNIQQLGLPSQSATEPYQFTVPGWSATSEAGDLLHEAGARYKQTGTRVVEGRGTGNMQPWEAQQNPPFNLPQYAQEPGAVFSTEQNGVASPPPAEPVAPTREAATPPETATISHREPIMTATAYQTAVRPGSDIRQATTVGGPSILTTDPEVAAGHLDQIERIVQDPNFNELPPTRQADILQSRDQVLRQMQEYKSLQPQHDYSPYLHQPTFAPVDIEQALSRVGDMGDAAEEMMRGPKEMYQQWTNLTKDRPGGSFQDINEDINDLGGKSGADNRRKLAAAQQEMQRMFNGSDPYLGRAGTNLDRAMASAQFSKGYLVDRANDAFTNAWSGAERSGDFSISKLQSNWKSLVNEVGSPKLSNALGPDRYEAMNNIINDMAAEPAADKAAIAAAKEQHQGALADWEQREAQRTQLNKANQTEYDQKQAARDAAAKQKWYYDLARNGWSHLASRSGLEAVANVAPRGVLAAVTHKVGAALVLKKIITHPAMAKLAYQAAQIGTNPALYAPIVSDMIRAYHKRAATNQDSAPTE